MSLIFSDRQEAGRIVGAQHRSEMEADPAVAYRRGQTLDRMLRAAAPQPPRGVTRGSHEYFNRVDAERQVQIARRINTE